MMNLVIVGGGTAGWLTALFIKKIFPPISEDLIIYKILKSTNEETKQKYKGLNKAQIKAKLDILRDASANLGSTLHEDIEKYYNNIVRQH